MTTIAIAVVMMKKLLRVLTPIIKLVYTKRMPLIIRKQRKSPERVKPRKKGIGTPPHIPIIALLLAMILVIIIYLCSLLSLVTRRLM